jgi:hypothetical protein
MPSSVNRTSPTDRPRACGPARTPRRTAMLWIAVVGALALATTPRADAADVGPLDLALTLIFDAGDDAASGTATLALRDGDLALDMINEGAFRLFALLRTTGADAALTVNLYAADGDGWSLDVTESATIGELLSDDERYLEFAHVLMFMLSPASPLHPCVRMAPEDGVLEGDFSVWDCGIVEAADVAGRSTTKWSMEHMWGRSDAFAIWGDPEEHVWIDDAWDVPLRYETPAFGFVMSLVAIESIAPDPARFQAP